MYLRGALGCVIVCASNEAPTLQETIKWKGVIQENSEGVGEGDIPCLLVQNKSDLITPDAPEPHQTQKYLDEFAKANGFFGAMQCSAKENKNVEEIFQTLLDEVYKRGGVGKKPKTNPTKNTTTIVLDDKTVPTGKSKKKCCG